MASSEHVPAISFDINPVMATFSAAKSVEVLQHKKKILEFVGNGLRGTGSELSADDPILLYFSQETAQAIRNYIDEIPFPAEMEVGSDCQQQDAVRDQSLLINSAYSFCKAAMFVTLRRFADKQRGSNPTWLTQPESQTTFPLAELTDELVQCTHRMLNDLDEFYARSGGAIPHVVMAADTRKMPLLDGSVDRVITSPPYLTRIDYAVSTSFELALFGGSSLVTHVRHNTMGAPVITGKQFEQHSTWGLTCNEFLQAVATHPTKAAKSYYWKNLIQYFADMERSLDEIVRVLAPGGSGLIVVQSSYFKDIEAKLGEMYVEMAQQKGLTAHIAYREEVKGHLAHVNTRSNVYKANKVYFEDFVYVEKKVLPD